MDNQFNRSAFTSASLARYMHDLRVCQPMPRDHELAVATEYRRTRDAELGQRLVRSNLRLVVKIAAEYCQWWGSLADLVQEGNLGLLEAVRRFDPARGIRLASYATWWIRAFILKYLLQTAGIVRSYGGRDARRAFFRGEKRPADVSLDQTTESGRTLLDVLGDDRERADQAIEAAELRLVFEEQLRSFMGTLKERDAVVFRERLLAEKPRQLREIAERFSISKERVRQVESGLVERLRRSAAPSLGLHLDG